MKRKGKALDKSDDIQSRQQEKSKLDCAIITNIHTLLEGKMI